MVRFKLTLITLSSGCLSIISLRSVKYVILMLLLLCQEISMWNRSFQLEMICNSQSGSEFDICDFILQNLIWEANNLLISSICSEVSSSAIIESKINPIWSVFTSLRNVTASSYSYGNCFHSQDGSSGIWRRFICYFVVGVL